MATATFYPDYHPESTSVDGRIRYTGAYLSFANLRAHAGDYAQDNETAPCFQLTAGTGADTYVFNARIIMLFPTGATIPAGAVIDSATLTVYITGKLNSLAWSNARAGIAVVDSTPASNTALAVGDYQHLGSTRRATDIAYNNLTTSANNTWTLTDDGSNYSYIKRGSDVTKLGMRLAADVDNDPGGWIASTGIEVDFRSADYGGVARTNCPYLTVNWHLAAATVAVSPKVLTVVKYTPGVQVGTGAIVSVTPKALTVVKKTPTIQVGTGAIVNIVPKALEVDTKTPTVAGVATISTTPATPSVVCKTPAVQVGASQMIAASCKSMAVASKAPGFSAGLTIAIPPPALEVSAQVPTVMTGGAISVSVSPADLEVTTYTPTVAISSAATIAVTPKGLSVTKKMPAMSAGAIVAIIPATRSVAIKVPTVTSGAAYGVAAKSLTVTPHTPNVVAGTPLTIAVTLVDIEVTTKPVSMIVAIAVSPLTLAVTTGIIGFLGDAETDGIDNPPFYADDTLLSQRSGKLLSEGSTLLRTESGPLLSEGSTLLRTESGPLLYQRRHRP